MPAVPRGPTVPEGESGGPPATTLHWAIGLLALQAAGLTVLVAVLAYEAATAPSVSAGSAVATTAFAALFAALLGLFAWALWRRHAWARGPAIVLELLLLPIGYTMVSGGLAVLGVPVMALGLAGAVALFAPATRAALGLH